jgi:hypothetical protein
LAITKKWRHQEKMAMLSGARQGEPDQGQVVRHEGLAKAQAMLDLVQGLRWEMPRHASAFGAAFKKTATGRRFFLPSAIAAI